MDPEKRKRLESDGWRFGDVEEFLDDIAEKGVPGTPLEAVGGFDEEGNDLPFRDPDGAPDDIFESRPEGPYGLSGEHDLETLAAEIANAKGLEELLDLLWNSPGIESHTPSDLHNIVRSAGRGAMHIAEVPETAGLREKVQSLLKQGL